MSIGPKTTLSVCLGGIHHGSEEGKTLLNKQKHRKKCLHTKISLFDLITIIPFLDSMTALLLHSMIALLLMIALSCNSTTARRCRLHHWECFQVSITLQGNVFYTKHIEKPRAVGKNLRDPRKSGFPWMLHHWACMLRNRVFKKPKRAGACLLHGLFACYLIVF